MKKNIALIKMISTLLFMSGLMMISASHTYATQIEDKGEKAVVALESYEVVGGSVEEGGVVEIKLIFTNKSTTNDAKSFLIRFTNSNGDVYPLEGETNQIYIGEIKAGEVLEKNIKANIAQEVDSEDYIYILVSASYIDDNYSDGFTESLIRMPLVIPNRLKLTEVKADQFYLNSPSKVTVSFENEGDKAIGNLTVRLTDIKSEKVIDYVLDEVPKGLKNEVDFYFEFAEAGSRELRAQLLDLHDEISDSDDEVFDSEKIKITVSDEAALGNNITATIYGGAYAAKQYLSILVAIVLIVVITIIQFKRRRVKR